MKLRAKLLALFGVVVAATAVILSGALPVAVQEPKFAIVLKEGDFEIRDYAAAVAAEVTVTGDQKGAAAKGFRLLAGYIFGGNARRQSIAMTAPVAQAPVSEKIAMTAPVTQTPAVDGWVVRFTMPSGYSVETLPEPNDPRVVLRALAPARFAVIRFSGLARETSVKAKTAELNAFVKAHNLRPVAAASLAQYNPPWTLWFMRRNEVMIQIEM